MPTYLGNEGSIKVGPNAVAEVKSFRIEESMTPVQDTAMGATGRTFKGGIPQWTGEVTCHYDPSDANGQEALAVNASVTFNGYPSGETSGDVLITGTALVQSRSQTADFDDSIQELVISLQGSGVLERTTVTP